MPGASVRSATTRRTVIPAKEQLRVLIATDVLSEGQNLQDAAIIVNYDLPWAIIRLVQRAGRVDRIGQKADRHSLLLVSAGRRRRTDYSLPRRVRQRLRENAEVVGTDEAFFEDDRNDAAVVRPLPRKSRHSGRRRRYRGRPRILRLPDLEECHRPRPCSGEAITELPPVVFSTKAYKPTETRPGGVLAYVRTQKATMRSPGWMGRAKQLLNRSSTF